MHIAASSIYSDARCNKITSALLKFQWKPFAETLTRYNAELILVCLSARSLSDTRRSVKVCHWPFGLRDFRT